jgi:hypothetical protein
MTADDKLADALNEPPTRTSGPTAGTGTVDVTPDGATVNNVVVTAPILTDWSPVFELFNLDAAAFEVVDDTVRMSTWQQSKRTDDGRRDAVQLYSYSARFRRITAETIPAATVDSWRVSLQTSPSRRIVDAQPAGSTYVMLVADPQLGKKGTAEAVDNWRRGVDCHLEEIARLGRRVNRLHVAFMGDEFEGVANNYANQAHTVELNKSRQIELAYDLEVWTLKRALSAGLPVSASAVVSNHGEWTRNGSKDPVTTRNDNGSTHIARQVAKLFDELAPHTGRSVSWTIGDDHPGITLNLSGVRCYFSHGYVEKGRGPSVEVKTRNAIERQILGRTDDLGDVDVWFMAHYHHHYSNEFEGRALFGCPALEAERSSEYMLDQYGVWSPPGMLGLLVGVHASDRGWANLNVY